jgi:hypothetical protein
LTGLHKLTNIIKFKYQFNLIVIDT